MSRKNFLYNAWRADDEEEEGRKTEIRSHDLQKNWRKCFLKPKCTSLGRGR